MKNPIARIREYLRLRKAFRWLRYINKKKARSERAVIGLLVDIGFQYNPACDEWSMSAGDLDADVDRIKIWRLLRFLGGSWDTEDFCCARTPAERFRIQFRVVADRIYEIRRLDAAIRDFRSIGRAGAVRRAVWAAAGLVMALVGFYALNVVAL